MKLYEKALIFVGIAGMLAGCSKEKDWQFYSNIRSLKGLDARVLYTDKSGKKQIQELIIGKYDTEYYSFENNFFPELIAKRSDDGFEFDEMRSTRYCSLSSRGISFRDIDRALEEIEWVNEIHRLDSLRH